VRRIREKTNLPKGEDGASAAKTALLVVAARAQGVVAGSAIYSGDPVPEMCKITEAGRHTARRWQIARYRKVHPYFVGGGEPYAESR
jgi:hypothetical protein